jgi:hypothetical protein
MNKRSIAGLTAIAIFAVAIALVMSRLPPTPADATRPIAPDARSTEVHAVRATEAGTSASQDRDQLERDREPARRSSITGKTMELKLVDPRGEAVPGVHVTIDLFRASGHGDESDTRVASLAAVSDAHGWARVELERDLALRTRAAIAAARLPELACKAGLVLAPPLAAEPHTIDLLPTGSILVHVKDRAGGAVPGISVEAKALCSVPIAALAPARSNANGELRFDHIPAGAYVVEAIGPRAIPGLHASVRTGNDFSVDAELTIESSARELAVSGVVVDEHGAPLGDVSVQCRTLPDGASETIHVTTDGKFEFVSTRSEMVDVSLVRDILFDLDEFEPARVEVPFGSTNVSFRRVRVLPRLSVIVHLIDADDRHALVDGSAMVCPRTRHGSSDSTTGQLLHVFCKLRPDWIYILRAPGHRSRVGSLEELQQMGGTQDVVRPASTPLDVLRAARPVEITLEKGFEEEFAVRDAQSAEPIAGVILSTSAGAFGTTDAQGFVTARGPTWPHSIKFEHQGYVAVELDPSDGRHATGEVLMQRVSK